MEQNQKKYYRAKEVAILLGVSRSTIWRYAKNGLLAPKKITNGVTVFDVDELNKLIGAAESHEN